MLAIYRTPGHRRSRALRQALAAVLIVAAGLSALSSARALPRTVVFARDVPAGHELLPQDVTSARLPSSAIPATAANGNPEDMVGRVIVAAASAGEVVTTTRILSADLVADLVSDSTENGTGGESHMIPLKLAEPDIIPHLHHGDTVNVVSAADYDAAPSPVPNTIAAGGKVVSTGSGEDDHPSDTVLLALPADLADYVAAASLSQPLTVVIVGERANPHSTARETSTHPR